MLYVEKTALLWLILDCISKLKNFLKFNWQLIGAGVCVRAEIDEKRSGNCLDQF